MPDKIRCCLAAVFFLALSGCVKEDLSDCPEPEQGIVLRYRYDLNMDYADKFAERVENLQAFIFDGEGILRDTLVPPVGAGTITPGWERKVNLPAGDYSIVTWAGSDNFYDHYYHASSNGDASGYRPGVILGRTRLEDMKMFLKYEPASDFPDDKTPCDADLKDLYHGMVQHVTVPAEGFTAITTPLVKNTNTIRIRIDGLPKLRSGANEGDFELSVTGCNSHYKYDNTIGDEASSLRYIPSRSRIENGSLHADIRTLRLMRPESDPLGNASMLLDIRYKPGRLDICKDVNLVDLILSGKIPARDAQGNLLTDSEGKQEYVSPTLEYLDRQDLFEIVYEIEENPADGSPVFTVYVNDWKITHIYPVPTF